ncbi:MAG: HopJ type III effector protein [Gallionella sp.]
MTQHHNFGSCKLFSFAQLNGFLQQQTRFCFGAYYRDEVLKHPQLYTDSVGGDRNSGLSVNA